MTIELPKVYSPTEVEKKWYEIWESNGYFLPSTDKTLPPFVIVIPPPNVTGSLHMGHALDETIQDILIRYKRMNGFRALWVPGTDHAGIATQNVVEKELKKQGQTKEKIGREQFLSKVWEWKELYGGNITRQLRRLGASCDWSRERFTMDPGLSSAVRKAFVTLYKEGLIYKGKRLVNWCPRCTTAISDIEVEHESKKGSLWYIRYEVQSTKYKVQNGAGKGKEFVDYIVVATTRPETMLGDTAVAVNPKDERYSSLIGNNLVLPLVNRTIPVIADELVDAEFGTGAVKVTPAHDPNDFDMGERHDLTKLNIMTEHGKITLEDFSAEEKSLLQKYDGLDRDAARAEIVKDLEENGYLDKITDHENSVGKCYRCSTVIEPFLSDQWFVKVAPLAKTAIEAVESGDIEYIPARWSKVYIDWMTNLRDWCISRQIWWGHRIPVWYCACGEVIVSENDPENCPECGSSKLEQDPDVLDTWFSSSLWPFSTLGWPENTQDLKDYYPTSVLVTGYDIITFWVSKMIMMGLKFQDKKPFSKIFIHGLIRDIHGKKMSKSSGNVMDPVVKIDEVGADALRFALASLISANGQDFKISDEKITEGRNFANKIWNVSRFVLMQEGAEEAVKAENVNWRDLGVAERWILSKYNRTVVQITELLNTFEFGEAARRLYEFIWSELCDWYVEMSKVSIYGGDSKASMQVLVYVLKNTLKILHPFMPFETEEIYQHLSDEKTIMLSSWPKADLAMIDDTLEEKISLMVDVVRAIRNIRAEMGLAQNKEIRVIIAAGKDTKDLLEAIPFIKSLGKCAEVEITEQIIDKPKQSAASVVSTVEIFVPLEGLVDLDKEKARLTKSLDETNMLIKRTNDKLSNSSFVSHAKPELVEAEKLKLEDYTGKAKILEERLKSLS